MINNFILIKYEQNPIFMHFEIPIMVVKHIRLFTDKFKLLQRGTGSVMNSLTVIDR